MGLGRKYIYILVVLMGLLASVSESKAQRIAVSTNAVGWLALSPNVGLDLSVARHHTLAMSVSASPWKIGQGLYLNHITVSPEYKYWFSMPYSGHYLGGGLMYSSYDIAAGSFAAKGNLVAACVNYGYSMIIGTRWNLVPFVGLGAGVNVAEKAGFAPAARLGLNIQVLLR